MSRRSCCVQRGPLVFSSVVVFKVRRECPWRHSRHGSRPQYMWDGASITINKKNTLRICHCWVEIYPKQTSRQNTLPTNRLYCVRTHTPPLAARRLTDLQVTRKPVATRNEEIVLWPPRNQAPRCRSSHFVPEFLAPNFRMKRAFVQHHCLSSTLLFQTGCTRVSTNEPN